MYNTLLLWDARCAKGVERLVASPPGDELPSPAVWLRQFQLLEHLWSSGDTTVIDRDKSKYPHTHTHTSKTERP
jgi:hypothetical protein